MSSNEETNKLLGEGKLFVEVVPNEQGKIITGDDLVLIDISAQLPVISSNFEIIKTHILTGLKEFEVTVTLDNIDVAKKMATSLNQLATKADDARKSTVKTISEPIS